MDVARDGVECPRGGQQRQRDMGGLDGRRKMVAAMGFETAANDVQRTGGENEAGMGRRDDRDEVLKDPDEPADYVGRVVWLR